MAEVNEVLTVPEVAQRTRVSEPTIRRLLAEGRIKAVRIGGQWRIARAEVDRIMREGTR